jgi:predicted nucleic acid-binding protein
MIVLDTNVLSELMRPKPEPRVLAWVSEQPRRNLYSTAVTQAEILYGIAALPHGKRRKLLLEAAAAMFGEDLAGRILPFGGDAAARYAELAAARRKSGQSIEVFDALIAAVALAAGASVATRDASGFAGCGLTIINPWEPA